MKVLGFLLVLCPIAAQASFDMALIADNTAGVIHRYDPVNRVYLGNFGAGMFGATVSGLAVDRVHNWAIVAGSNGETVAINYDTGELAWSLSLSVPTVSYDATSNQLLALTGAVFVKGIGYPPTGITTFVQGNSTNLLVNRNGSYFTVDNATGAVQKRFVSTTAIISTYAAQAPLIGTGAKAIDINESGSVLAVASGNAYFYGLTGSASMGGPIPTQPTTTALVWGHGDTLYTYGQNAAGAWTARRYSERFSSGAFGGEWTLPSQISRVDKVAMVLAPEPASLSMLAFGLVPFLKRRRKNN